MMGTRLKDSPHARLHATQGDTPLMHIVHTRQGTNLAQLCQSLAQSEDGSGRADAFTQKT